MNNVRHLAFRFMELNGETASTTQEICQLFTEKFINVFNNEGITEDQVSHAASYVPLNDQSLSGIDVQFDVIIKVISKLKSSHNPGPDGVPSELLKKKTHRQLDSSSPSSISNVAL